MLGKIIIEGVFYRRVHITGPLVWDEKKIKLVPPSPPKDIFFSFEENEKGLLKKEFGENCSRYFESIDISSLSFDEKEVWVDDGFGGSDRYLCAVVLCRGIKEYDFLNFTSDSEYCNLDFVCENDAKIRKCEAFPYFEGCFVEDIIQQCYSLQKIHKTLSFIPEEGLKTIWGQMFPKYLNDLFEALRKAGLAK